MDYPSTIQIETTGACNASCSFCPHAGMTVAKPMPTPLIEKLVSEAASWPSLEQFIPFLTNEPFADGRMPDIMALGNQKLPNSNLIIFTNGSLISDRVVDRLKENKVRITRMFFSVHHSTADEYESELGIPFDKTLEAVRRAMTAGIAEEFVMLRVNDYNEDRNQRFRTFMDTQFPGMGYVIPNRFNWKGDIDPLRGYEHTLDEICGRQKAMCVLASGKLALCCLDQLGEHGYGDANTHTLLELYNTPKAIQYRTRNKRENSPCHQCNMH